MSSNRISHHFNRIATEAFVPVAVGQPLPLVAASSAGAPSTSMVMVPVMAQQATWQAQLYQLAYQQAVAALTPPRHHRRFFSVWN
jgi:hypothetical protein